MLLLILRAADICYVAFTDVDLWVSNYFQIMTSKCMSSFWPSQVLSTLEYAHLHS